MVYIGWKPVDTVPKSEVIVWISPLVVKLAAQKFICNFKEKNFD